MFDVVIGHSEDIDAASALEEILEACRSQLHGRRPSAGLLFAGMDLAYETILKGVTQTWSGLELIGCTTDGEISSKLGFAEDSVSLTLFVSDAVEISAGIGRQVSQDLAGACREAVAQARARATLPPRLCITMPDGLTTSIEQIVDTLNLELGGNIPLFGGAAGDYRRFESTQQFFGDEVLTDAVPVMLFSGPLLYAAAVDSGWRPIGRPGVVTRAEENVLYEIDGRPALAFYRHFLGSKAAPMPDYPFAILDDDGQIRHLRTALGSYDAASGSMTFSGNIPEGVSVQLAVADRDGTLEGCKRAIRKALDRYPRGNKPQVGLLFSCAGRKVLLGTRTRQEVEIVQSECPGSIPICGFYAYGEIGPSFDQRVVGSCFHNQTFVALLMGT